MDGNAYVLRESRRRIVVETALYCVGLFAVTAGIGWIANAADGWPVPPRHAVGLTAVFFAAAVLVFAIIATGVLTDRDTDRDGVSLVIDRRGVYLGGRPARQLAWSDIGRVAAFVGDRHDDAPSSFWSDHLPAYECCFEFMPKQRSGVASSSERHHVERGLRREFESVTEIAKVRSALLHYAPTKVARGATR
jgi:hypothetical protein